MYGIQSIRKWSTQIRMKYQLLGEKIEGDKANSTAGKEARHFR